MSTPRRPLAATDSEQFSIATPSAGARRGWLIRFDAVDALARIDPRIWLLGVAVIGVVIPAIIAALTGNLAIPHNDAWAMSRITQTFAETGHLRLLGWNDMNLVGQVVMLGPLGSSLVVQQLAVAALGLICLYCVYHLVGAGCGPRRGAVAALLVVLWPGWASLTTSFMTDVPALVGTLAALAVGRRAFARDSRLLLAAALVAAFWAVSIREQALAAPAVLLGYGCLTGRSRKYTGTTTVLALGLVFGGALLGFEAWRAGLPAAQNPTMSLALRPLLAALWSQGPRAYATLALPIAPAVIFYARPSRWSRGAWLAAAVAAAIMIKAALGGYATGNYLTPNGEYYGLVADKIQVIPPLLWQAMICVGVVSGVLLAATLVERRRAIDPILGGFTALTALATLIVGVTGNGILDRYLLMLVPGVLAIVLAPRSGGDRALAGERPEEWRRTTAAVSLVIVGAIAILLTLNSDAFDRARWDAGAAITARGVSAARIDAGLEWMGWHSPSGARYSVLNPERHPSPYWVAKIFSRSPPCAFLSPAPLSPALRAKWGLTPTGSYPYRTYLLTGSSRLYAYDTHAAGCPAPGR